MTKSKTVLLKVVGGNWRNDFPECGKDVSGTFRDVLANYDAFGDDFERFESGYGINMPAGKVGARLRDWSGK